MCKCCSNGKHVSKYKQFLSLHGHTHSHDGEVHTHEHDHDHLHTHMNNHKEVRLPVHGREQEAQQE